MHPDRRGPRAPESGDRRQWLQKEAIMFPLLLWILGVPGVIIILLLLLGVIHL
jgi:hypothetical protein